MDNAPSQSTEPTALVEADEVEPPADPAESPDTTPDVEPVEAAAAAVAVASTRRWWRSPTAVWNALLILAGGVVFTVLGWQQRWISDDGLIVLRTVRNLLAGNGPVFNASERVEVNTSTLWTYLLTVIGSFPGVDLETASVVTGLVCSALGLMLGMDAARRLHRPRGGRLLMPVGAAVLLAVPPVRDFATSGLETGLVTLWLGAAWWLTVRVARGERRGALPWVAAVVLGLGPLVRPELAVFSVLALPLLVVLVRPGIGRFGLLVLAAGLLPVGYQVFRAGYYGLLVPNTAIAKEASGSQVAQGLDYLQDTADTYWLWIPLGVGVLLLGMLAARRVGWADRWATIAVALLPPVAAVIMVAYVVRVGGDFMHGRMLLPGLTALLLPVFVVPLTRWTALPVLGAGVWVWVCVAQFQVGYGSGVNIATGIVDERAFWSNYTGEDHPLRGEQFSESNGLVRRSVPAAQRVEEPGLLVLEGGRAYSYWTVLPARDGVDHVTVVFINLGMLGSAHDLDVRVVDGIGLSNPLASHVTPVFGARVGHDKDLPQAWFVADEVAKSDVDVRFPVDVAYARRALACPERAEVLASTRDPLTADRFWANLTGSIDRTGVRWSRIPQQAAEDCSG